MSDDLPLFVLVAARVGAAMKKRRMSKRHLAIRAGLAEGTIRQILEAKDTKVSTLVAVASALGLEFSDLVGAGDSFSA